MKKSLLLLTCFLTTATSFAQWSTNGNNVTIDKNIGIGTTNPQAKLDVNGDINARNNIIINYERQISTSLKDNFTYDNQSMGFYAMRWGTDSWNNKGASFWLSAWAGMKFFVGEKPQLVINSNGNVGIGTVSPQTKLDVNGAIRASEIKVNTLEFDNPTIVGATAYTNLYYPGHFLTIGSKPGIARNNVLELKPGGANTDPLASWIQMYTAPKQGEHVKKVVIHTAGTSFLNGGNVGIGIENPKTLLDVNGVINARDNIIIGGDKQLIMNPNDNFTYDNQSMGYYAMRWGADSWNSKGASFWLSAWAGMKIFVGDKPQLVINSNGSVGIGTTNPRNKLDVNGTIRAREVKVEVENWSDFVFDKDYKLPSLHEVEAHINEHKHLPNIPSEVQVKEEGINLSEMQAKLLQKIEELTLYVIEQDKKIELQNREIQKLNQTLIQQ